jgi:pimeloyl-ACP methyl ester carboxylesterase
MPLAQVNGIQMHYELAGSGTPLLLIHGLGSSSADWDAQIQHFAQRYQVIAPDLRGHARSSLPPGPYSIKLFAADIAALLKSLAIEPAHIVGISLGGAVAFQLALDAPALTRTLTIVNSAPEMILRTFGQKFAIWQRLAIVRLLGLPRMAAILGERLFPSAEHAAARTVFVERFKNNKREPYLASLRALIGWSVAEQLSKITCPTLVIAADQDYTPIALKEDYVAKLPNARLAVIPDSRHAVPMERPEEFNRVLGKFLSSSDSMQDSSSELLRQRTIPIA